MRKVLLFDCDGVLADTEVHGHLPAFNRMWREARVPWQWTLAEYGRKLSIGGGKERMASLFDEPTFQAKWMPPLGEAERTMLVSQWHRRKSEIYREIIESGLIPARSGVKRLAGEALDAGWTLGVASTSAPESVNTVLRNAVGEELAARFALVLAGEVVAAKKPSPDIYTLAAERLGVAPADCVVIEDSNIGLRAAMAAGMRCVVTVSSYTRDEDFTGADLVLTCLGDPGGEECDVLANQSAACPGGWLTLRDLEQVLHACLPAHALSSFSN